MEQSLSAGLAPGVRVSSDMPARGSEKVVAKNENTKAGSGVTEEETEPSSHQAHSLPPPPLLLPPPAFATVAPDIYRCSSSFPTPQDIAFAASQGRNPPSSSAAAAAQLSAPSSSSAAVKEAQTRASGKPTPHDTTTKNAANPSSASSSNVSSSSAHRNRPASTRSAAPDRDSAMLGLRSYPGSTSSLPSPSASSLPTPSRNSPALPPPQPSTQGSSRPRSRVNSASSSARHHHTSALSAAAAMYTPFLNQLHLRTVLVLGWERPSKTLERYCRDRNIRIVHLALDGSRIGPARKVRHPPSAPSSAPGSHSTRDNDALQGGSTATMEASSSQTSGRNDPRPEQTQLSPTVAGPLSGTNSLFAASVQQSSLISERMVKDGLELILDKQNHPVMIMDTIEVLRARGRGSTGVIRASQMFDTDLTTLPPAASLPPFFVEQLAMDEEELDQMYGF
ncbi:hypothetical protein OC846_000192 [Tilletia horrida]|uniref:Uncharacterized protein n=1 Tax=Tilletia horrida TaxID=155126 RepID=A0AAN6H1C2_9BASI|nr:hypothetical protein OC846_000192 [Tilletia horrida]